ncbi:MAG TPA: SOS response-associated peptidase [Terracidiphilus sp.]|nr:SOS response-associated peptidase [Terracidiphilus sp.]
MRIPCRFAAMVAAQLACKASMIARYAQPMCGRFARRSTQQVLADWFGVELEDMPWFAPTYNAAPQSTQPVVRFKRDTAEREVALLRWGLVPFWAKDPKLGYSTFNARAEEVASKPVFREAMKKRRCLVPSDAFYEWKKLDAKTKKPFAFALRSGEPYAFAGLWERWKPKEGEPLESFSIITTDCNDLMEPIHDRMPVILDPRDYERWLEPGDPARLPVDLLRPYPAEKMKAWTVSEKVGNVRNDEPDLLAESEAEVGSPRLFP